MAFDPFCIGTCEEFVQHTRTLPFTYPPDAPFSPFEIADPFGLRKAVVPVFRRDASGRIYGLGTAFHVDGWGSFLTADHVIDFLRVALRSSGLEPECSVEIDPSREAHVVLLLGIGVVLGTPVIPQWAFAPIVSMLTTVAKKNDPMADLRGNSLYQIAADLASMQALISPNALFPHSIKVRLNKWHPTIGEYVFAVGFPQLKPTDEVNDNELRALVEDGMCGAYGCITNVFPSGRDITNPTPVFEVSADWQSGMSGGPVFNQQGEVVGIVSRSLAPDGDLGGVGYATCLGWMPNRGLIPSLDTQRPGLRIGYGVLRRDPWHLAGVFRTKIEAVQFAISIGDGYQVVFGSHKMGSDEFVS